MTTVKELIDLYKQGKYRELINLVDETTLNTASIEDEKKLLQKGWAYHQLGEYGISVLIFAALSNRHSADTEIGESARRGLAHGLLQGKSDIEAADRIMQQIPPGLERDNVRMNIFIMAARKGLAIPAEVVVEIATNALQTVPATPVNGHIINNGALVLYEIRDREATKPYLYLMPIFIVAAISIYKTTGTAKNHIASAEFQASKICEAMGNLNIARAAAKRSVELWRELVSSQDGGRYQQNLEGAEAQLKKLS